MNNLDSGAGSLRADIAAAQSGDTIVFAPSLNGRTITLTSGELSITKGLTIQGPGAGQLTVSGPNSFSSQLFRVLEVNASQPVLLSGLTISNGHVAGAVAGGGIFNHTRLIVSGCNIANNEGFAGGGIYSLGTLTASGCTISNNHGENGGGIYNTGTMTVSGCTLIGDSASPTLGGPYTSNYGGGIFNTGTLTVGQSTLSRDTAVSGGGIYNRSTLTVSASTLSANSVHFGNGGGIYAGGLATLTNCTFSFNEANNGGQGGGLFVVGHATLTNCTLSLNTAGIGGGIHVSSEIPGTILNLTNTIVAGNTKGISGPDIFGAVATADHNLVGNATDSSGVVNGVNGNIVGGNGHPVSNALLGPLQNNGGPTQTMALLAGSPAIGHANNFKAPATDQRGLPRIDELGELTDIGAFEL
jgi:hypothetical protein